MQDQNHPEQVINNILRVVSEGQRDLSTYVQQARTEQSELLSRMVRLKGETLDILTQSDRLEHEEIIARLHLADMQNNPDGYRVNEKRAAEEKLRHLRQELLQCQRSEQTMRHQRHQLEDRLRQATEMVMKIEKMEPQIQAVQQLLSNSAGGSGVSFDDFQMRHQLGLRIIKAQEEERLRVAREIHDGPAQSMANVVLRAEICEKLMAVDPDNVKAELQDLKEMVKISLHEVRKIIFNLRPMVLDDLGIIPTLRRFITELQKRTDMSIELVVLGGENERLSGTLEVAIFRIVQEALNNILKHAGAKRCVIKMEIIAGRVNITIVDDGCGFDTEHVMKGTEMDCFGLLGMRERVQLLDGQIRISSATGKGTEIHVRIPVKG
jgi:two-component system, NarL family, sensor histidine kinase DegS